ncbi:unnamed protein product [Clonostachys rosea]|uniref:Uncharacterized protein n=1 Tax=Bionectria ochroleuca TaxID=29856 RepID=A0ABY6U3F8_BIOOC|nr:unnamed protein product [Clonostachys rosea]
MLSHSRLHQHDSATADLKTTWLPSVHTKPVPSESVLSDDEDEAEGTIIRNGGASTLALGKEHEASRKTSYTSVNGTTAVLSHRTISAGLMSNRHVSQAMSVVSKREGTVYGGGFSTSHQNHPLYDTSALWKLDRDHVEHASLTVELDAHMRRALDRYVRSVGCALDFKRSVTSKDFLTMVTNERLRYMPDKGSRLDKILKKAESFGVKFDKIMAAMKRIEMPTYESSALVLSSCKNLLGFAAKHSFAVERLFTALDEAMIVILAMSNKLGRENHYHSHRVHSIFQAALAMVVDIVVDVTASFGLSKSGGINEKTIVAQFETMFEVVNVRLTQLRAELYLQTLVQWCDNGEDCNTEKLLLLLQGFEDFGLETCPPAYLHILVKVCMSLSSHAEHTESLKWFRFLWTSLDKHRHDCELSYGQWFEVYVEYLVILGLHEEFSERLLLAEEFQALLLAELGSKHLLFLRARIEFAKILELDSVRYTEAVTIYEELGHCDFHGFEDCNRDEFLAVIEITKYRLSLLFESHPDLGHRAEVLLVDSFHSLKLELCLSNEKVIIALTRIIEYHRKQKRQGSISAAITVMEEYILGLLVEERNETILFEVARTLAKLYRELSSVETGIKFIQYVKDQVLCGGQQHAVIEGHCKFSHDQIAQLDRRCFVFIHAFEQLLCGYEREKMLQEIIRDIYTETCLYEAWSVSLRQTKRDIHVRLAAGARLIAYLDQKGRHAEMRAMRTEVWEMFQAFAPSAISTESLWQLFELTLANIHKKAVSFTLLECLVDVGLEVFTKLRDYSVTLQLLRWSQMYFKQFTKTQHSKAVALAFRISECFSRRQGTETVFIELQTISSEILVEVLKVSQLDMDFGTIPFGQLNVIIRLLGQHKNFSTLERILQYLWDTRMTRNWSGAATVATGRRLCEVKFAAGHQTSALVLLESICYNLRDVYGSLHRLTVECETLRAGFHNTCGNHRAARDIHVHLLEQVGKIDRNDCMHDQEHLNRLIHDQSKRLKWVYHNHDDEKQESFYNSLLRKASGYLSGHDTHELGDITALSGEKRETKWKCPEDWSLPINEIS